jgi:hypothetical protein
VNISTLERMANQIAANAVPEEPESVDRVTNHMRSFWTAQMIAELSQAQRDGRVELTPVAAAGLAAVLGG